MQGIVQVQVQEKAGLTFASALRSILRQDPNVVLIGEIRDRETAQIAVQPSLTGHLVLSTLHTNDASNAVTRLVDIGVEAYKIAAALRGVLAQRLMRKLCPTCKQVWMETPADRFRKWLPKGTPLYRAAGCPDCAMTGYRGRFSIVEVLTVTPEVERRIASGETAEHIAGAARRGGMKGMWESGLEHVLRGESTLDELTRDGYDVAEARDGVQALDQIDRVGPDVIVLDLNLPGLDGYGVLSHLRSRPATASIPVIVLTAKGDEDNEVRVFELGADDFLTKPFRARALSARLEAVLGRRR